VISTIGQQPNDAAMEPCNPIKYGNIDILPPANPTRVVALAHNYYDLVENNDEETKDPLVFLKTPSSVIAPNQPIEIPEDSSTWAEVELAFVVDKQARNISPEDASDYIRGYTVANDVTTEGIHGRNWHLPRSKARETFCPVGPHLIQGVNTQDLNMSTQITSNQTQSSTTSKRIYGDKQALSLISSIMTLDPGDLVLTGTPDGATDSIISHGDEVKVEIESIGTLENPVKLNK
jgi:2-keto-4-pentenoate hydratase/2-oxohepta-3-ene-1,7-dioic acid hydratase in catechol pathway